MRCPKCSNEIKVRIASKMQIKSGKVMAPPTTIITIQCENCKHMLQTSASVGFSISQ